MRLVYHGGHCCGIKTIYGLGGHPNHLVSSLKSMGHLTVADADGSSSGATRFYHLSAPGESHIDRLDRYLAYCDKRRPNGIVEIVLADNAATYWYYNQYEIWRDLLIKRGFKEVNKCLNSNSGNNCYVFHRNSGEVPVTEGPVK